MTAAVEGYGTIGERARRRAQESAGKQNVTPPETSRVTPSSTPQPEPAPTPQPPPEPQASSEPSDEIVGRHRAEYIRDQGEKPISVASIRNKRLKTEAAQTKPPPPVDETSVLPTATSQGDTPAFPRRVPQAALQAVRAALPGFVERTEHPAPSLPNRRRTAPPARSRIGIAHAARPEVTIPTNTPAVAVVEMTTDQPDRSAPARQRPKKNRLKTSIALATATVITGVAIIGSALAIKKAEVSSKPEGANFALILPKLQEPPKREPPIVIPITESGIISPQGGNQWGASANIVDDALLQPTHEIGSTNIVAKTGAYDSQATSPDPDDADAGDTFIAYTKPAIEVIDQLQEPLPPGASQAEIEAAQIINQLNSLGPMETQEVIERYGNEIEALKQHIYNILNPQQENQTTIESEQVLTHATVIEAAPAAAEITTTEAKAIPFFKQALNRIQTALRKDPAAKGRKATTALARDRDKRKK